MLDTHVSDILTYMLACIFRITSTLINALFWICHQVLKLSIFFVAVCWWPYLVLLFLLSNLFLVAFARPQFFDIDVCCSRLLYFFNGKELSEFVSLVFILDCRCYRWMVASYVLWFIDLVVFSLNTATCFFWQYLLCYFAVTVWNLFSKTIHQRHFLPTLYPKCWWTT